MSADFTIEVEGLTEAQAACERVGRELPDVLKAAMALAVRYVQGEVPEYPAEPPDSTYRRRFLLERSLAGMAGQAKGAVGEVRAFAGEVLGIVGTAIPYASEVIGEEQAKVHAGRWWRLGDVVEGALPGVEGILEEGVGKALAKL